MAKPRNRLVEPAAAVESKPGPAIPAWQQRKPDKEPVNDVTPVRNKRAPATDITVTVPSSVSF